MLDSIPDLTAAFNGREPFPDLFRKCMYQNLIETGSAIRFNDYELDDVNETLKEEGIRYMYQVMPTFIERAAKYHPDIPLTHVITNSFKVHARTLSSKNDGTIFDWYKTFLKLILEANKTTSLKSKVDGEVEVYSEYLNEKDSSLLEVFIIASENYFNENEKSTISDLSYKISNHEEAAVMSHLKAFSDYLEIEAKGKLTPAQLNFKNFEKNNLSNWIFKSALSDAHIFVLDNTSVKQFIAKKELDSIIPIPPEVKKVYEIACGLFPDDPIAAKQMINSHFISLPKEELSVSGLEL